MQDFLKATIMMRNSFLNVIRYLLKILRPFVFFKGIIPRILKSLRLVPPSLQDYIFFKGQFKVKTISGNQFYLLNWGHPTYELENKIFWNGLYSIDESTSIKVWEELSMVSSTIIDVGANTGIFTLVAKSANPNANVIAFEPITRIYEKLLKNIHINKYDAAAFDIGISNFDGKQEIYDFPDIKNPYSASLDFNLPNEISLRSQFDLKKILISTKKLDSFINEMRIKELTNTNFKLKLYQVHAITAGTDAQGEVTVRLEDNNISSQAKGSDPDIIVASSKAYINALNKLIFKKNNSITEISSLKIEGV